MSNEVTVDELISWLRTLNGDGDELADAIEEAEQLYQANTAIEAALAYGLVELVEETLNA